LGKSSKNKSFAVRRTQLLLLFWCSYMLRTLSTSIGLSIQYLKIRLVCMTNMYSLWVHKCFFNLAAQYYVDSSMMSRTHQTCSRTTINNGSCARRTISDLFLNDPQTQRDVLR